MKRIMFTAFVVGLGLTASLFAQVPSYVPINGLVGWWPFNGNANDESGNGNNATVNGATLTTDRFGNSGTAFNYNAFNWSWGSGGDYTYIPFNSSFNTSEITISVWFSESSNYISNQDYPTIVKRFEGGYSNPNGQTWGIFSNTNGDSLNTFILPPNTSNNYPFLLSQSGPTISSDQWHNAILSFDGISMKTYFNGQLISSIPANGMLMNANGNSGISIGMSIQANGNWDPFNGKIDDIAIWNRALTQQEISVLYSSNTCSNDLTISPSLNTQNIGVNAIFTATTTDSNPTFTWQSDFGQGFQTLINYGNYSGINTNTLTVSNLQLANHNQPIRAISTSGNCTDTSNIATIQIADTCITNVSVYDTLLTTVTDTLIINTTLSLPAPNNENTILIYPNPASDHITIDNGNFAAMAGYSIKIENNAGQQVFQSTINQAQFYVDLSTWTGNGLYFVHLIDPQNNTVTVRKIVLQ